jgi:hypothetical protein
MLAVREIDETYHWGPFYADFCGMDGIELGVSFRWLVGPQIGWNKCISFYLGVICITVGWDR